MKTCTSCMSELPITAFSPQKTNPAKLYAWCDACRKAAVPHVKPFSKLKPMREKALELRKLNDEQVRQALKRYKGGEKVRDLAPELGVSKNTLYKEFGRVHD